MLIRFRFADVAVLVALLFFLVVMNRPTTYESTAELLIVSSRDATSNGKNQPVNSLITEVGSHAIKRAILERSKPNAKLRYDDIKLDEVEVNAVQDGVWEILARYSADGSNSSTRWKARLDVVPQDDKLLYLPTEVWSGDDLDQLEWKRKSSR